MKAKTKYLLLSLLLPFYVAAQWPGYFYAFTLTDAAGKLITLNAKDYIFNSIQPATGDVIVKTLMCDDSATIRFYVGGNNGLYSAHKLEITRLPDTVKMVIEFPPSISGGSNKYFRNLFLGNLNFKKDYYKIRLPATGKAWDNLKEKHFCPDYGNNDSYWNISLFQHQ